MGIAKNYNNYNAFENTGQEMSLNVDVVVLPKSTSTREESSFLLCCTCSAILLMYCCLCQA